MRQERHGEPAEHEAALVIGASGALGGAVARALDALGLRVALHYHGNETAARKNQSGLANPSMAVRADVADWAAVRRMGQAVRDGLGPVHALVNCGAVRQDDLLAVQPVAEWERTIQVNLLGAFHAVRAVVPEMLRRQRGRIVNVVSPAGLLGSAGQTAYSASKAGVIGLTRSLAVECGRRGVTVNALSPGFMESRLTEEVPAEVRDRLLARVPLGRDGTPEEVARGVTFLVECGYITGQVLSIDGGLSIA